MKNLILSAALLLTVAANAKPIDVYPENEKVVKTFNEVFKEANDVTWNNTGRFYEAFFTIASIKTRAMIDNKGNLIQTIRYYKENELPANVLYSVKKEYAGKDIFGVTEVSNKNGTNYRIILRDEKSYTHINANNIGDTEVVFEYKRGDK